METKLFVLFLTAVTQAVFSVIAGAIIADELDWLFGKKESGFFQLRKRFQFYIVKDVILGILLAFFLGLYPLLFTAHHFVVGHTLVEKAIKLALFIVFESLVLILGLRSLKKQWCEFLKRWEERHSPYWQIEDQDRAYLLAGRILITVLLGFLLIIWPFQWFCQTQMVIPCWWRCGDPIWDHLWIG